MRCNIGVTRGTVSMVLATAINNSAKVLAPALGAVSISWPAKQWP